MSDEARYPLATATLLRLLHGDGGVVEPALAAFRLGPAVLRAPPAVRAGRPVAGAVVGPDDGGAAGERSAAGEGGDDAEHPQDLLGELVDMVLVTADDSASRHPEVHLQFKAEVFGGLHLRLQKTPEGLVAAFTVADAAARRAVVAQVDGLLERLRGRGFAVVKHSVDIAGG